MSTPSPDSPVLRLPVSPLDAADAPSPLPGVLSLPGSRADGSSEALLSNVTVKRSWTLVAVSRGDTPPATADVAAGHNLLALEADDGSTVFMRADTLADQLRRTRPDLLNADGSIDFSRFRDTGKTSRGLGSWIWRKVSELELGKDRITRAALDLLGEKLEDKAVDWASRKGATALMAAIESQLAGPPGLYAWTGGLLGAANGMAPDDPQLTGAVAAGPLLVFIHGTGSHTLGSFGALPNSAAWKELDQAYPGRIFGFEHRTFSESPVSNALLLAATLPAGARLHLVTHSRGGLVGDLLCLDPADPDLDALINQYTRPPGPDEAEAEQRDPARKAARLQGEALEQQALRDLVALLRTKRLRVERYVRVACPARGTALLSDNLDLFLSGLLNATRRFLAWGSGALAGAFTPALGPQAKAVVDETLRFLTRVVLEIADKRIQPGVVPGIEAMLPEAPMSLLLGRATRAGGVRMALIAGDLEGDPNSFFQRIGVLFVDWALFDRARNDLVVDTESMYGGVASRGQDVRAIFVQGPQVNHFRYFRDEVSSRSVPLPRAIQRWLCMDQPEAQEPWQALERPLTLPAEAPRVRGAEDLPDRNDRPVLVYLPGIMGSHLKAGADRVWLDPLALLKGHLTDIAMGSPANVEKDGLVQLAYGELATYLEATHQVIRCDYDWRQPLLALGKALAATLKKALESNPDQPVRILAHSMGGLVTRAAFAFDETLWDAIVARPGGRLVMLGTPNNGSHLFVETLLGQSDTIRTLARADLRHGLQAVLDVVAGFPGALHLLPAPNFVDTAGPARDDYYAAATWTRLAAINDDFWFGRALGGRPAQAQLQAAAEFWQAVADTRWIQRAPDRVAYVFGQADNTPCGILVQRDGDKEIGVVMRGTPNGDGSVTWQSGRLPGLGEERCWYMPVDHMGLTSTSRYFGEIQALLGQGQANRLGRLPVSRGDEEAAPLRTYRAGPPPAYPSELELCARALGGRLKPPVRRNLRTLTVAVKAMDLRFVQVPLICGHYRGDPISGAESIIDRWLVAGALSRRQHLGIHSGELGNATVALAPRSREERLRKTGRGAVVVGLGEMGKLSADGVTEAVRAGVLRYLLHAADAYADETPDDGAATEIQLHLASLLIGTNSAAQLDVAEAVKAIVLGVLRANREFTEGTAGRGGVTRAVIGRLDLIEVYRDAAISAAHALYRLNDMLRDDLPRLESRLDVAEEMLVGEGVCQRLGVTASTSYWPRLAVTDADRDDTCGADDLDIGLRSPLPPETLRRLLNLYGRQPLPDNAPLPAPGGLDGAPAVRHARRLRFVYMGEKARAEAIVQQNQPGTLETLVDRSLRGPSSTAYGPDNNFGNTLFQLLVPVEFKTLARKTSNLILVVDEGSANLPWEMLEANGQPLICRTRMVRQFATGRFRQQVVRSDTLGACVIANPDTRGFHAQFGPPGWQPSPRPDGSPGEDALPSLNGAAAEGEAVKAVLEGAGYEVRWVPPGSDASQVYDGLFAHPWRVLVICAHGIYGRQARDGSWRSGVVLSDGLLLSASEIGRMENVPDLVFLSCCNLGKAGIHEGGGNRLAASLARELIDMGVRCVVAAGWEVRDDAAQTFSETFFTEMTLRGARFGDAVFTARNVTLRHHPDCNTWGAYQAYGDPSFQLQLAPRAERDDAPLQAPEEFLDWLEQRRLDCRLPGGRQDFAALQKRIVQRLRGLPAGWEGRPDVQALLGSLYAEYRSDGFEAARAALLRAIGGDSSRLGVPIASIELLANIEARQATSLGTADAPPEVLAAARSMVDTAVRRLEALLALEGLTGINPERQALLGSALKRQALLAARSGEDWKLVAALLTRARDAYLHGEGNSAAPGWDPYALINRLQLDALLGARPSDNTDLDTCIAATRDRFQRSFRFFDAVMQADAVLTGWLLNGALPGAATEGQSSSAAALLIGAYRDAIRSLSPAPRDLDSTVKQLALLAEFLAHHDPDDPRVDILNAVAADLAGVPSPPPPAPAPRRSKSKKAKKPDASEAQAKPQGTEEKGETGKPQKPEKPDEAK